MRREELSFWFVLSLKLKSLATSYRQNERGELLCQGPASLSFRCKINGVTVLINNHVWEWRERSERTRWLLPAPGMLEVVQPILYPRSISSKDPALHC